mmetsp:Transcript_27182/g.24065  ORF Transcript_27182/g.24065 Transcript_27182/m.24065 type:complete len:132 (+) Transcript_27182:225-620(+)
MTPEQLEYYRRHTVFITMDSNINKMVGCPFCKSFEIWPKIKNSHCFICPNEACKMSSCTICCKKIELPEGYKSSKENSEELDKILSTIHKDCVRFRELKGIWEQALEKGRKRFCPECGIGGIKDDACTHMT